MTYLQHRHPVLLKIKHYSAFFVICWLLLVLTGCYGPPLAAPVCRATPESQSNIVEATGAACLLYTKQGALLIQHRFSGKLDLPADTRKPGESLACAAHRAAWEQTGFNVEVAQQLATTASGLPIFDCRTDSSIELLPRQFNAPPWAEVNVTTLEKVDPFLINKDAMRFADDLIPLRDAFVAATQITSTK